MSQPSRRTSGLQKGSFLLILATVSIIMASVVWPFATTLLWSALAAVMFQPLYRRMLRLLGGRRNPAALLSLLIIFCAVLAPALWIGWMVVQEAVQLVNFLQANPLDLAKVYARIHAALPAAAQHAIDNSGWASLSAIQARVQKLLLESSGLIAQQAVSFGGSALGFVLSFLLALYIVFFLLRDGHRIGEIILESVPIERDIADRLAERFLGIVRATIKGTGVVGIVQGTLGGITLAIAGISWALLGGVLMVILSIIPVIGTVAVWGPVGLWLLATGALWQGLFVLITGFVVISSVDNVLRPILVGRDTGIPDWIVLVTTLGGISLVGFSGIVLGPLAAGLFLACWSILREQHLAAAGRLPADAASQA
ncbi:MULTISPECIES: AI-2E family transporter [Novosphingobium]|uniref:AI-2E family transporter n=1 Tax=Novosphingobium TaxID=165696 RepID=UPI000D6E3E01|nr:MULTISPECIES: AI-2E family transporter [Novosphingobium]